MGGAFFVRLELRVGWWPEVEGGDVLRLSDFEFVQHPIALVDELGQLVGLPVSPKMTAISSAQESMPRRLTGQYISLERLSQLERSRQHPPYFAQQGWRPLVGDHEGSSPGPNRS